jgi:hypothetical protein
MADPAELVGLTADERLLDEDMSQLPAGERRQLPTARGRRLLVGVGVALTGATLLAGIALLAIGAVDAIVSGLGGRDAAAIAAGALLVATHWGWVHVAEAGAGALDARRRRSVRAWLHELEPHTRWSVTTRVLDDGSIAIARVRHDPVRASERTFTFVASPESEQVHSGDEPAALVSDRAETARRLAAADTARERRLYELAADAYETALLERDDDEQRRLARRAAAQALSERINENLRDPPLAE